MFSRLSIAFAMLFLTFGSAAIALDTYCEVSVTGIECKDPVAPAGNADEIYFRANYLDYRRGGDPDIWEFKGPATVKFKPRSVFIGKPKQKSSTILDLREQEPFGYGRHKTLGTFELKFDGTTLSLSKYGAAVALTPKGTTTISPTEKRDSYDLQCSGTVDSEPFDYVLNVDVTYATGSACCLRIDEMKEVSAVTSKEGALDGDPADEFYLKTFDITDSKDHVGYPRIPHEDDYYQVWKGRDCKFTNRYGVVDNRRVSFEAFLKPEESRTFLVLLMEQDGPVTLDKLFVGVKSGGSGTTFDVDVKMSPAGHEVVGSFMVEIKSDKAGNISATWTGEKTMTKVSVPGSGTYVMSIAGMTSQLSCTGAGAIYNPKFSLRLACEGVDPPSSEP